MKILILLIVLCGFKCTLGQNAPYLKRKKAQKDSMYQAGRKRFYSEGAYKYTIYFGKFHSYSEKPFITAKDASNIDSLVLANKKDNRLIAEGHNIKSFHMMIIHKGRSVDLKSNSNMLTKEMKSYIKSLDDGKILVFDTIIATNSMGEEIKLGSVVLKINNNI